MNCAVAETVKYAKRVHPGVLLQIAAASLTVSTTRFPRTSSFSQISCRFKIMRKEFSPSSKAVFRTPTKHVAVKGLTLHTHTHKTCRKRSRLCARSLKVWSRSAAQPTLPAGRIPHKVQTSRVLQQTESDGFHQAFYWQ